MGEMGIFYKLTLAGVLMCAQTLSAGQADALLVVWDSTQPRGAGAFKGLVELLKRQRAQGHFVGVEIDPGFLVYDFAVPEHALSLQRLGLKRPPEPLVCLTRLNPKRIPQKLTWSSPVHSPEQAMTALDQRLGIGLTVASPSPTPPLTPTATPSPIPVAANTPAPVKNQLTSGNSLWPGMTLESSNHLYRLVVENDGNCVVYRGNGDSSWETGTGGKGCRLVLERTGLLQVENAEQRSLWHSSYEGMVGSYRLSLQDDGDLIVEQQRGADWTFCWSSIRGSEGNWKVPPGMRLDRGRGR